MTKINMILFISAAAAAILLNSAIAQMDEVGNANVLLQQQQQHRSMTKPKSLLFDPIQLDPAAQFAIPADVLFNRLLSSYGRGKKEGCAYFEEDGEMEEIIDLETQPCPLQNNDKPSLGPRASSSILDHPRKSDDTRKLLLFGGGGRSTSNRTTNGFRQLGLINQLKSNNQRNGINNKNGAASRLIYGMNLLPVGWNHPKHHADARLLGMGKWRSNHLLDSLKSQTAKTNKNSKTASLLNDDQPASKWYQYSIVNN